MLKRLAILAVIIAAVGFLPSQTAPLSAPKQGITKPNGGEGGKEQTDAKGKEQGSAQVPPITVQKNAPVDETAKEQARENLDIERKVEWFTGVLALVGVFQFVTMALQAWLLYRTKEQIQVQARHMETQTGILKDSVAAAQTSANAAAAQIDLMKNKERPRVSIAIQKNTMAFRVPDTFWTASANLRISNDGFTQALNIRALGTSIAIESEIPPPMENMADLSIPTIIKADSEPLKAIVQVRNGLPVEDQFRPPEEQLQQFFIHTFGKITYTDYLGDGHHTTFRYRIQMQRTNDVGDAVSILGWERCGPPEDNTST